MITNFPRLLVRRKARIFQNNTDYCNCFFAASLNLRARLLLETSATLKTSATLVIGLAEIKLLLTRKFPS